MASSSAPSSSSISEESRRSSRSWIRLVRVRPAELPWLTHSVSPPPGSCPGAPRSARTSGSGCARRRDGLGRREDIGIESPAEIARQIEGARIGRARVTAVRITRIVVPFDADLLGELPILFLGLGLRRRAPIGCGPPAQIMGRAWRPSHPTLDRFHDDRFDRLGRARRRAGQEEGVLAARAAHPGPRSRDPRIVELEARRTFLAGDNHVAIPARGTSVRGGPIPPAKSRVRKPMPIGLFGFGRGRLELRLEIGSSMTGYSATVRKRIERARPLDCVRMTKGFHYPNQLILPGAPH